MITVAKNSGIILYFIIVTAPIQNIIVCIWPGKDIHRRSALRAALIPQQDSLRSAVTELRLIHAHAQNIKKTMKNLKIENFEISILRKIEISKFLIFRFSDFCQSVTIPQPTAVGRYRAQSSKSER